MTSGAALPQLSRITSASAVWRSLSNQAKPAIAGAVGAPFVTTLCVPASRAVLDCLVRGCRRRPGKRRATLRGATGQRPPASRGGHRSPPWHDLAWAQRRPETRDEWRWRGTAQGMQGFPGRGAPRHVPLRDTWLKEVAKFRPQASRWPASGDWNRALLAAFAASSE